MTGQGGLPPPRPIPIRDRASILFIERGQLDVIDGAFVVVDATGVRTVIPVGGIACLMLEPGSRVSHAAVVLAARAGTVFASAIRLQPSAAAAVMPSGVPTCWQSSSLRSKRCCPRGACRFQRRRRRRSRSPSLTRIHLAT